MSESSETFAKLSRDQRLVVGALLASVVGATKRIESSELQLLLELTRAIDVDAFEAIATARETLTSRTLLLDAADALPVEVRSELRSQLERLAAADGSVSDEERALLQAIDERWDVTKPDPKSEPSPPPDGNPLERLLALEREVGLLPRGQETPFLPLGRAIEVLCASGCSLLEDEGRRRLAQVSTTIDDDLGTKIPTPVPIASDALTLLNYLITFWDVPIKSGVWMGVEMAAADVERTIRKQVGALLDYEQVAAIVATGSPERTKRIHDGDNLYRLTPVLSELLEDQLPLRPIDAICAAFLEGVDAGDDQVQLVRRLRRIPEVRAAIHHRLPEDPPVFELSSALQHRIRPGIQRETRAAFGIWNVTEHKVILSKLRKVLEAHAPGVLVVPDTTLQLFLRAKVHTIDPRPRVVAEDELPESLRTKARTSIEG